MTFKCLSGDSRCISDFLLHLSGPNHVYPYPASGKQNAQAPVPLVFLYTQMPVFNLLMPCFIVDNLLWAGFVSPPI